MLVRCIYASRATKSVGEPTLDAILKQSRRNNAKRGVTGMLCFSGGIFLQVIEGGRAEVSRLLATLYRDERHSDIELLAFEDITERQFSNWTMGQVNIASVNQALLLKYSDKAELNPFGGTGRAAYQLLLEMAESGAIAQR